MTLSLQLFHPDVRMYEHRQPYRDTTISGYGKTLAAAREAWQVECALLDVEGPIHYRTEEERAALNRGQP
jgi:hypothetical protein